METATFATGCFWCTEAIYQQIKGVESVTSGYSGGTVENPTDMEVYSGNTGHAECVQIKFDSEIISYKDLLEIFWRIHDPTSLNKQGYDVGTEYRSAIFYHDEKQKKIAEDSRNKIESEHLYPDPIVTEISEYKNFYEAEDFHKNFYKKNPNYGYCRVIIDPKILKLRKEFGERLK